MDVAQYERVERWLAGRCSCASRAEIRGEAGCEACEAVDALGRLLRGLDPSRGEELVRILDGVRERDTSTKPGG